MYREWNVFGRLRQALVHILTTYSRPPSSTVLDVLSTVSALARNRINHPCELVYMIYESECGHLT